MPIVDASLVMALALNDERAPSVEALIEAWLGNDEELHAPALLPYEVASGLTRAAAAGGLRRPRGVPGAWRILMGLPLTYHPLGQDGEDAVAIAQRLARSSAYDAAYLALARAIRMEVWTFDKKLARNAGELGYPVKLVDVAAA